MFERLFNFFGYVKKTLLEASLQESVNLRAQNEDLSSENSRLNLQNEENSKENENLKDKNLQLEFQKSLIAGLLNESDESWQNEHLQNFCKLCEDFLEFAKTYENEIPIEFTKARLQAIEKELKTAISRSEIYTKNVIAVVGGFNAGKSAFISSFFADKSISLPLQDKPSTAISTFVLGGEKAQLIGISNESARVNLSELDSKIHSKIAHDFIDNLGFKLKKLMPFMLLKVPLLSGCEHLCFIDTPGYASTKKDDEKSAKEFLADANALIWLIDIGSAATLTSTDIGFLKSLDLSDKKLFVVLNRADLLDLGENESIESIANAIIEQLKAHKIDFVGVSVCQVEANKRVSRYEYPKMLTLDEFLQSFLGAKKEKTTLQKSLMARLDELCETYKRASEKKLIAKENKPRNSKPSKLDGVKKTLNTLTNESLSRLFEIISAMKNAVDKIFGKSLEMPLKKDKK